MRCAALRFATQCGTWRLRGRAANRRYVAACPAPPCPSPAPRCCPCQPGTGNIVRADIVYGRDGRSRGYGTVRYETAEEAQVRGWAGAVGAPCGSPVRLVGVYACASPLRICA